MTADDRQPVILDIDGPRDPLYVAEVADAFAEAVRVLNHLTRDHAALEYPSEADRLIRGISTAASRLPQLLGQVSAWVNAEYAAGRIRMTGGEFLQPVLAAMAVEARLGKAAEHAEALRLALDSATAVTSAMAVREDDSDERS